MMIHNASDVTCQLGSFCFESTTLYRHLSAFKYSKYSYCWRWEWKWERMGIELSGKIGKLEWE